MSGPLVDAAWLAARPEAVVLDATVVLPAPRHDGDHRSSSGRYGWAREHIPGSVHADLLDDLSDPAPPQHFTRPEPGVLAGRLGRLGVVDGATVVVYDRAGGLWAARLWWLLRWIGVEAYVLDGGLAAWAAAGLPTESGPVTTVPGTLTPRPRDGLWVGRDDLVSWLDGAAEATVVCALAPEVFRGETPTRYARRGHIPGSVNVPARALTDHDGRYLDVGELRAATSGLADGPVWIYCGGGVSAAALALVLIRQGRDDVAIYDGSLEEWAADPALPLAIGAAR
ncbi:sulfurtransferase [Herbidospora yilanensis]|uniref:sulfurtransferase n=1 Tax=Herbidospora yilanensis TaxID=354426 RepID=UPI000781B70A|nr:rhodanese-like domain-containing protein [Herbidospora yilanensis]